MKLIAKQVPMLLLILRIPPSSKKHAEVSTTCRYINLLMDNYYITMMLIPFILGLH